MKILLLTIFVLSVLGYAVRALAREIRRRENIKLHNPNDPWATEFVGEEPNGFLPRGDPAKEPRRDIKDCNDGYESIRKYDADVAAGRVRPLSNGPYEPHRIQIGVDRNPLGPGRSDVTAPKKPQ